MPANIRQQPLQGLLFLPGSVGGQPGALETHERKLRTETPLAGMNFPGEVHRSGFTLLQRINIDPHLIEKEKDICWIPGEMLHS